MVGEIVSHYRIVGELGSGGMGVVYRAEDVRLDRPVAIKFLPERLAENAEALERFRREARTASALNHPGICSIFDIGWHDGRPFLVMELLEGETLKTRIGGVPLPQDVLLDWAAQMIDALDAAHQRGIIHRDIKPSNLFVTTRGHVKILDFGLARAASLVRGDGDTSDGSTATVSHFGTIPGSALGTLNYMSPEQARGEELDVRTDIFSFGLVLYEMATGREAFPGRTPAIVVDKLLNDEPRPPRELNPAISPALEGVIGRCLEKDREKRYQSAGELCSELKGLCGPAERPPRRLAGWLMAAAVVVAILLAVLAVVWRRHSTPPAASGEPAFRQITANPSDMPVTGEAISADGNSIVFSDVRGVHVADISGANMQDIPATEGAVVRCWYPNGTVIVSRREGGGTTATWTLDPHSGAMQRVGAGIPSPDGAWLLYDRGDSVWISEASGARLRKLVAIPQPGMMPGLPVWSPDARRLAYAITVLDGKVGLAGANVSIVDPQGGPPTTIFSTKFGIDSLAWVSPQRLAIGMGPWFGGHAEDSLWILPLESGTFRAAGAPHQAASWTGSYLMSIHASQDGRRLTLLRQHGQSDVYIARLSPDGKKMEDPRRLTLDEREDQPTAWTHDSRSVLFFSNRSGMLQVYRQDTDKDTAVELTSGPQMAVGPRITADGRWVLYNVVPPNRPFTVAIRRVPVEGGASQRVLGNEGQADVRCSLAGPCILQSFNGTDAAVDELDPLKGRGKRLFLARDVGTQIDISPDGRLFAWALATTQATNNIQTGSSKAPGGRIRVVDRDGRVVHEFAVAGAATLNTLDWAAGGRGLYVGDVSPSDGVRLLHTDLQGNSTLMWRQPGSGQTWGIPSPNGKLIALAGATLDSNAWLVERF